MASPKRQSSRKSIAHPIPAQEAPVMEDKENVTTDINALTRLKTSGTGTRNSDRRARSKSLGPGGLDAPKNGTGNRRKTAASQPRSILKPTVPLSPLREIPTRSHAASAHGTASSVSSPQRPAQSPSATTTIASPKRSPRKGASSPGTRSPSKTVEPTSPRTQTIAFDEQAYNEAREKRQREREAIQKQREARRKSMANRRVSFAPEATLHTWDHIEDMQDSTTSSASTDATRRASSTSEIARDPSPLTPSHQAEDDRVAESPVYQQDSVKQRRRRSSGIPPMNFNNPLDSFTSSPADSTLAVTRQDVTLQRNTQSHSPTRDQSPQQYIGTSEPLSTSGRPENDLDELDENGEQTMEMVDEDVTAAFRPWSQLVSQSNPNKASLIINSDQENINPFSPIFMHGSASLQNPKPDNDNESDIDEMSMDITHAIGGIMPNQPAGRSRRTSTRRQSIISGQNSSSDSNTISSDETMEFTTVIGGIQSKVSDPVDASLAEEDQNEELSMEFTSVFGGIQSKGKRKSQPQLNQTEASSALLGTKQQQQLQQNRLDGDGDSNMLINFDDVFDADKEYSPPEAPSAEEVAASHNQTVQGSIAETTPTSPRYPKIATPTSQDSKSAGAKMASANLTPSKSPQTPSKQITPQPTRPSNASKTPTPNVSMRTPSPRKLFRQELKLAKQIAKPSPPGLSSQEGADIVAAESTSTISKTDVARRISGIGFDKEGLGSPRVADLLDRRASIGDQADIFAPQSFESRDVHFENPRYLNDEVSKDKENERRESGQFVIEEEAGAGLDERDTTTSLKQAIENMTPKKNKLKGRKSLATGSAKGLLGKRPAELDEDEEEEGTPQAFKGRQASPVKKIRLQAPPSASDATRRAFSRRSLGPASEISRPFTPVNGSPAKKGAATTPSHKGHFKDTEALPSAQEPLPVLGQTEPADAEKVEERGEERIHLQDFLNMTNIRFMELNTTKRRHTAVTPARNTSNHPTEEADQATSTSFEDAVVAGACTLPMLELYQHSCRELKKYISEGRKIVREIESNTYEENPPLFEKYMSASPHDRAVMDNQFKNMKTHARLLSKGMWYEWRMKLLDGLKEGLLQEAEGLSQDESQLNSQATSVAKVLPSILEKHKTLEKEYSLLQARANELANCDQEELREARQGILSVDEQIRQRTMQIEKLQARSKEMDVAIENTADAKAESVDAIKYAQKMLSDYRGWSPSEVNTLKANVDALEAETGWSIVSCSETQLQMTYLGQLQLSFNVEAFLPAVASSEGTGNSPLHLAYIGGIKEHRPEAITTEKRFFLKSMQMYLDSIEQRQTHVKELLQFVSNTWADAVALSEEITKLRLENLTECTVREDERLAVRCALLLPAVETKVNVWFEVGLSITDMSTVTQLKTKTEVVYGEKYHEDNMATFLESRIKPVTGSSRCWASAFRELRRKLIARGRK